jgi:hypothetical protein
VNNYLITFILKDCAESQAQLSFFENILASYELKVLTRSLQADSTLLITTAAIAHPHLRAIKAAARDCFGTNLVNITTSY